VGVKDNSSARHLVTLPRIPHIDMQPAWISRAHYEIIKSLEYV